MAYKVDYQKINSLKAKVYDRMVQMENNTKESKKIAAEANLRIEPYNKSNQDLQLEVNDLTNQIHEEESKIKNK